MTDAAVALTITRESFYALYWDHARELSRTTMCVLAKFTKEYSIGLSASSWDEMEEFDRVRLRASILDMLEVHEHNRRRELERRAALRPQPQSKLEPGDAPGPADKISEAAP